MLNIIERLALKAGTTALLVAAMLMTGCASSGYKVSGVERSRILVDARYDALPDAAAQNFIAPYRHLVDSMMSPVVGKVASYMAADRPESKLSNLLADILLWGSEAYGEKPDFAVYNIGGMRAAFAAGDVTYGDVLDVAPFENKICFLTLSGEKVLELFGQIAEAGGEAVSHGVRLEITEGGELVSACLYGKEINPSAFYRVATLDYLSQGNDGLKAFKSGMQMKSPSGEDNNVRLVIMKYLTEKMNKGEVVDSEIEGRIKVKQP